MKGTNAFFFFKTDVYSSSFSYSSSQKLIMIEKVTIPWLYRSIYVSHLENESTYICTVVRRGWLISKQICTLPVSQFKQCIAMKTISGMFLYTVFFVCKKYEFYISAVKYFLCIWQHTCIIFYSYKNRSTALQHTMSITFIKSKYLSFLSLISKENRWILEFCSISNKK